MYYTVYSMVSGNYMGANGWTESQDYKKHAIRFHSYEDAQSVASVYCDKFSCVERCGKVNREEFPEETNEDCFVIVTTSPGKKMYLTATGLTDFKRNALKFASETSAYRVMKQLTTANRDVLDSRHFSSFEVERVDLPAYERDRQPYLYWLIDSKQ